LFAHISIFLAAGQISIGHFYGLLSKLFYGTLSTIEKMFGLLWEFLTFVMIVESFQTVCIKKKRDAYINCFQNKSLQNKMFDDRQLLKKFSKCINIFTSAGMGFFSKQTIHVRNNLIIINRYFLRIFHWF